MHDTTPRLMADLTGARVLPIQVAPNGCDDCSVEGGETHRYAACPGNQHRTVTTQTAFPDFAPGDARYLLADVHRWARTNGWTLSGQRGWVNARFSGEATVAVDYNEHRDGFTIARKGDRIGTWPLFPPFYPADSVRQAVDLLVALGILPAQFSTAFQAGICWAEGGSR